LEGPFPPGTWDAGTDPESQIADEKVRACVDVSFDRTRGHVAFAGRREDGVPHVEIVASRAGTDWIVPWLTERKALISAVTAQTNGAPVSSLIDQIREAGLTVEDWAGPDLGRGTGNFYDLVRSNGLRHLPQPVLDVAAATAVTRPAGDAWLWDRKKSATDIAPLVAATGAVWLLNRAVEAPPVSAYETGRVEVI
ncbi:hypothetical protein, partial [Lysinibacillus sp. NPDC056185]|uniref:hypothetical protein n=1 Tax=Lysinibacillus sp. NPDC056185 TaxID=3345739 RepID=UPI0039EE7AB3